MRKIKEKFDIPLVSSLTYNVENKRKKKMKEDQRPPDEDPWRSH